PALPPPQLAQPRERVADHRGPGRLESAHSRAELALCLLPAALPAEHARVVRSAGVEQKDVVLTTELAHARTPLRCSFVIAHPLARGDEVATGPRDAVEEACLTGECDRCRLVEATHAVLQLAFAHERPPLEPEPQHFELRSAEPPAQLDRALRQPPRFGRVLIQRNSNVSLMDGEPAVIHSRLEAVDEAVGALQPAVGPRRLASEEQMVRREPGGYPRRRALLASLEVEAVGGLPGVEREPVFIQHLADPAPPFARLW